MPVTGPTLFDPHEGAGDDAGAPCVLSWATFPVRRIAFGAPTRYHDGQLTVDKAAALAAVRQDPRIAIGRSRDRRARATPCASGRCAT